MGRRSILFVLAIFYVASVLAAEDMLQILKTHSSVYCGKSLSDVLSLVCKGKYNAPTQKIHDHRKRDNSDVEMRHAAVEDVFQFPFISKASTENFMARFRRKRRYRRGVYNECCQKPCTYEVLKSYCAD